MRRWAVVLSAFTITVGAATTVASTAASADSADPYTASSGHAQAGPMGGVVPARDSNTAKPGGGGGAALLSYHGGPVRHTTNVEAIYWGTTWPGDKQTANEKQSGLGTLYAGLSNTNAYAKTNGEYYDSTPVNPGVTYNGYIVDNSAAPSSAPSTSTIANEVVAALQAHGQTPTAGWYYPVYIDQPRGGANYCAWHSSTTTGTIFQFGFFFNLDNDSGCDVSDGVHSDGLASLANVTGHEYSEMTTDPQLNAWYDRRGSENADKCAWTFGPKLLPVGGSSWKIQGNWSNNAYSSGIGYVSGTSKVIGCIDGTNA